MVSAPRSVFASARASRTLVLPCLPQPPGTGRKISGSASTETRGHGTTGSAKFYTQQLRELLQTAPQRTM